jgi:hypothetical protein
VRKVKIVFDDMPCHVDGPPPILLCGVLFRFADESGNGVANVGFNPPLQRGPDLRSDSYGRMMVRIANHESFHTDTEKSGYSPESVDLECSSSLLERERTIRLRKTP